MDSNVDELHFKTDAQAMKCLTGVSIMLVDDSRSVSEAIRMMAVKSGARIRRADSLESAKRHLAIFRPNIVIIDLGLPDGNGVDLARSLSSLMEPRPAVLVISAAGEAVTAAAAAAAGADGYLTKPIDHLFAFQEAVLAVLPEAEAQAPSVSRTQKYEFDDDDALIHDLENAQDLLTEALSENDALTMKFCSQFLLGVAGTVQDDVLLDGALGVGAAIDEGGDLTAASQSLLAVLGDRLNATLAKAS